MIINTFAGLSLRWGTKIQFTLGQKNTKKKRNFAQFLTQKNTPNLCPKPSLHDSKNTFKTKLPQFLLKLNVPCIKKIVLNHGLRKSR